MKLRVKDVKGRRDTEKVEFILNKLRESAEGRDNLVPHVIDAVKEYATIGDICGVFRDVFGEYKTPSF